jgi:Ni/Co efflux regulator RcnB
LKRILLAIVTVSFAACNSGSAVETTRDSITQVMDTQRSAVRDSVTMKADSNKKTIDSTFNVLKDSIQTSR